MPLPGKGTTVKPCWRKHCECVPVVTLLSPQPYSQPFCLPSCHPFVTLRSPFVVLLLPFCNPFVALLSPPCHPCHPFATHAPFVTRLSSFCYPFVTLLSPLCHPCHPFATNAPFVTCLSSFCHPFVTRLSLWICVFLVFTILVHAWHSVSQPS